MFAATHFDNLVVLLFFAAAIFFQILTKAAAKGRRRPPDMKRRTTLPSQMPRPAQSDSDETDEDRIRKFLEALGQPTTSKPPPPVKPRTDIPPRPVAPVQPPVGTFVPSWKLSPEERRKRDVILKEGAAPAADLPREIRLPGQISPVRGARTFRPKVAEAPAFEVHHGPAPLESAPVIETAAEAYAIATQPTRQSAEAKIDIATMIRSASGLRDAIILREIFGPPRSLQPLDLVETV